MSYSYDAEGRIVSAGGTAYVYDGAGERLQKPGMLYWKGAGSDALAETSTTDTNPTRYIFFEGKRIARVEPGSSTPVYYLTDNLGSTALVTDYLGNVLSESLFYPYGVEQVVLAGDSNAHKFTGKERDPESGLDNFGARYYASNLGRFMSPDWDAKPATVPYASFGDPQTLNLYSYVENAPLNKVDADGHATQ
jgi:RHS repeat-associated protein